MSYVVRYAVVIEHIDLTALFTYRMMSYVAATTHDAEIALGSISVLRQLSYRATTARQLRQTHNVVKSLSA